MMEHPVAIALQLRMFAPNVLCHTPQNSAEQLAVDSPTQFMMYNPANVEESG